MVVADLKCYHCGYVSAEIIEENTNGTRVVLFRPVKDNSMPAPKPGEPLRCSRCGGPVYLDDVRTIRHRPVEFVPKERQRRKWTRRKAVSTQPETEVSEGTLPGKAPADTATREKELVTAG